MSTADRMKVFDSLWPRNEWGELIVKEFWRRVAPLPLDDEQVRSVLVDYRFDCPAYEVRTPKPEKLVARLRSTAAGPEARAPHDSMYVDDRDRDTHTHPEWLARGGQAWIDERVAERCECESPEVTHKPPHRLGGSRCNKCGGSRLGAFLWTRYDPEAVKARAVIAERAGGGKRGRSEIERVGHEADIALGLVRPKGT